MRPHAGIILAPKLSAFKVLGRVVIFILAGTTALAQPPVVPQSRPRVAIVLSGGGGRGGAHIGALRALERAGVPIDLVVGTSFGALVGGLYAAGYSTDDLELILKSLDWNAILSNTSPREYLDNVERVRADRKLINFQFDNFDVELPIGLQAGQKIQQLLDRLTAYDVFQADGDFDQLAIPFRAVATDLLTGRMHVFRHGWLSTAIRSSAAAPGLFTPVRFEDTLLIDGGVVNNIPADVARDAGADIVIAIDVSAPPKTSADQFKSLVDVLNQTIAFQIIDNSEEGRRAADVVITPNVEGVGSLSFPDSTLVISGGTESVQQALPDIDRVLAAHRLSRNPANAHSNRLVAKTFEWNRFHYFPEPVVVENIRVNGLERYPRNLILRRLSIQPGASVSADAIDRDVSILYGTDLFLGVTYTLTKEGDDTTLTFDLVEKPPVQLGLGLRYDTDYQLSAAIDVLKRGFRGTQSELFFRGLVGNAKNFELGLRRRRAGPFTLAGAVQYLSHPRATYDGRTRTADYQDERYVASGAVQHPLTNTGRVYLDYAIHRIHVDGAVDRTELSPSSTRLAHVRGGVDIDTLDDFDVPASGALATAFVDRYERALGSKMAFNRSSASGEYYVSVKDLTVGVSGRAGRAGDDAPMVERFFIGGGRAFSFSSARFIGLSRDEVVARRFVMAGIELRYRVKRFQSGTIKGAYLSAIYDLGKFAQGPRPLTEESAVTGVGFRAFLDVRYVGPVRFELGRAGNRRIATSFSLGRTF